MPMLATEVVKGNSINPHSRSSYCLNVMCIAMNRVWILAAGIKSGQQPLINFKVLTQTTHFEMAGLHRIFFDLNINSVRIKDST